ncbi:class I SAM-dependent methyltransferase [Isoptericola sp. b441]|uniref:Class I SAM-dependent methyltransferase n=1 Tax=Actinotalea lenta TaxID=3064654 RepID=A0ABT9D9S4_9CELL|nr:MULTISPECIES: class I SAM-dependent methyltransferase [unclassified Isoptericola]MDO8107654.1 class I SAM-dependent methyltransferase [Isoptericola sp. b441]MDO8120686.1 class I SAM-dependent methyltransferase [Isoptericola sp. b490]
MPPEPAERKGSTVSRTAGYQPLPPGGAAHRWWSTHAAEYLAEHSGALGDDELLWCPEGLYERDAHLLGAVAGLDVLEVGAGAAQGSRWCAAQGARAVATDIAIGMLAQAARLNASSPTPVPLVAADARALPFADAAFDVAFTAFGALPFVPDADRVHREVARVLRPGGRWVCSVVHPIRWAFPDDPGERGLTAQRSYFDRTPYVETDDAGQVEYAEHHRTLGDHVADVVAAGLQLERLVEPQWPPGRTEVWGGWGPVRGAFLPGTLILCTRKPAAR